MSKYCTNCGAPIEDGAKFCQACGAEQKASPEKPEISEETRLENGDVNTGIPAPGYSERVNDSEVLAAVKKNRKAAKGCAFFLVPLPFVGFVIYSLMSKEMEISQAMMIGGIVSGIFLLFAIYSFVSGRAENTYDAVVTDKSTRRVTLKDRENETITEYITTVMTTDGKKKKIREREGSQIIAYDYLEIGDKFRYHPQFNFPYELYDKSKAKYIGCISCGTKNPVEADRCKKCNTPLLK